MRSSTAFGLAFAVGAGLTLTLSQLARSAESVDQPSFIAGQAGGERLASRLLGTTVVGASNETVGDVSDLLIDGNNRVTAVVIGVGGFLGVGEKSVAVPLERVRLELGDGEASAASGGGTRTPSRVILHVTRTELQNAPEFRPLPRPGPALPSFGTPQR